MAKKDITEYLIDITDLLEIIALQVTGDDETARDRLEQHFEHPDRHGHA